MKFVRVLLVISVLVCPVIALAAEKEVGPCTVTYGEEISLQLIPRDTEAHSTGRAGAGVTDLIVGFVDGLPNWVEVSIPVQNSTLGGFVHLGSKDVIRGDCRTVPVIKDPTYHVE